MFAADSDTVLQTLAYLVGVGRRLFLQAVPEILAEFLHQACRPIGSRLQTAHEEPEHGRLVGEAQTADQVTVLVEPLQTVDDVFDLGKREYAARAGEAYQLDVGQDLFAVLVADARYRTALHTAYARAEVEGCGQCSGGVLLLRDMLAEFHGVQVSAQDAGRSHDGNAFRIERVHQVADVTSVH